MSNAKILPGATLSPEKMPGHWLLARMGKRVLRPGGIELTRKMLNGLRITTADDLVEFAPGLGVTAELALAQNPASYTGIEADEAAAAQANGYLKGANNRCIVGRAENTGLPDQSATVLYGEAMLTMQTPANKTRIIAEAKRILKDGGRYGIHEMCLVPDTLDESIKEEISQALSKSIHVGARPLTTAEWKALFENEGFTVTAQAQSPMHLLELPRMIQDEGLFGALRVGFNILRNPAARKRVFAMRGVFTRYQDHIASIMLIAEKK